jgi:hypothetical protein
VEHAVVAEEARVVGEDHATPSLAHQRGTDEVRRLVRPDVQEDIGGINSTQFPLISSGFI